jgi:membrane protein DedA with SNARE-associated domain
MKFIIPDVIGDTVEPLGILFIGYVLGTYWDSFSGVLEIIASIIAVGVIMFILFKLYRRMTKRGKSSQVEEA